MRRLAETIGRPERCTIATERLLAGWLRAGAERFEAILDLVFEEEEEEEEDLDLCIVMRSGESAEELARNVNAIESERRKTVDL